MYDGRHTMGVTVAARTYGGRGTTGTATAGKSVFRRLKVDIPAVRMWLYITMKYRSNKNQRAALRIKRAIRQLMAPSAAKKSMAGR